MMKGLLFMAFLGLTYFAQADQLAYISKEKAEEVAAFLNKGKTVYLFCGCCAMEEPQQVRVVEAEAVYTGYENYWEVRIKWSTGSDSPVTTEAIDLAYVWTKGIFGYKTLGKRFKLNHDYCVNPKDWDNPENVEKDI